jgi:hypothetical protein
VRREPVVVGPPIGDEDESDVELLSISSEDEDEGHQQGRPPAVVQSSHVQNKAVGGRGGRGGEQQQQQQQQQLLLQDDGDDDDLGWDEEGDDAEPACWKDVNQADVSCDHQFSLSSVLEIVAFQSAEIAGFSSSRQHSLCRFVSACRKPRIQHFLLPL